MTSNAPLPPPPPLPAMDGLAPRLLRECVADVVFRCFWCFWLLPFFAYFKKKKKNKNKIKINKKKKKKKK